MTVLQSLTYVPMYWYMPRGLNSAAVMSALRLIGRTTETKARMWPAPSIRAASK